MLKDVNWNKFYAIKRKLADPRAILTYRNVRIISASLRPVVDNGKTYIEVLLSGAKEMISADIMEIKTDN